MLNFLNSLSIFSGGAIVCMICAALAVAFDFMLPREVRRVFQFAAPIAVAYCFYELPVWLGADDRDQFAAWLPLFLIIWSILGALGSLLVVLLLRRCRRDYPRIPPIVLASEPTSNDPREPTA